MCGNFLFDAVAMEVGYGRFTPSDTGQIRYEHLHRCALARSFAAQFAIPKELHPQELDYTELKNLLQRYFRYPAIIRVSNRSRKIGSLYPLDTSPEILARVRRWLSLR